VSHEDVSPTGDGTRQGRRPEEEVGISFIRGLLSLTCTAVPAPIPVVFIAVDACRTPRAFPVIDAISFGIIFVLVFDIYAGISLSSALYGYPRRSGPSPNGQDQDANC